MTRPKSKQSPPPPNTPSSSNSEGYCQSCGRLLPRENKSDPTPRKYCSTTCRSHSKSTYLRGIRLELIQAYHKSLDNASKGKVILCSEAEKLVFQSTSTPTSVQDEAKDKAASNEINTDNQSTIKSTTLSQTEQREESRRAARRLVAFGFDTQGIPSEDRQVEAIQNGKNVETSFAKGEWGIRWKS